MSLQLQLPMPLPRSRHTPPLPPDPNDAPSHLIPDFRPRRSGTPAAYNPTTYPEKAFLWAASGYTLGHIAALLRVSRATVCRWKTRYPEFGQAIHEGWVEASDQVGASLYKLAIGYSKTETRETRLPSGDYRVTRVHKEISPQYRAIALWLNRFSPAAWHPHTSLPEAEAEPEQPALAPAPVAQAGPAPASSEHCRKVAEPAPAAPAVPSPCLPPSHSRRPRRPSSLPASLPFPYRESHVSRGPRRFRPRASLAAPRTTADGDTQASSTIVAALRASPRDPRGGSPAGGTAVHFW